MFGNTASQIVSNTDVKDSVFRRSKHIDVVHN
jgi:hypothetical protein